MLRDVGLGCETEGGEGLDDDLMARGKAEKTTPKITKRTMDDESND